MTLDPSDVQAVTEYGGRVYAFCSPDCAQMFADAPQRYVTGDES